MLVEWHLTPEYIIDNWTDELLALMTEKFVERKQRELDAIQGKTSIKAGREMSDTEFFALLGDKMKVVKHGD